MADTATPTTAPHTRWNKGKLIGQRPPLKLREDRSVRTRLQMAGNIREIALFNLAIDSKLRGCDLVRLMVRDVAHGSQVLARATVVQQKTKQPVRFEVSDQTREALTAWIVKAKLADGDLLVPESPTQIAAPLDPSVRAHRQGLDRPPRQGPGKAYGTPTRCAEPRRR